MDQDEVTCSCEGHTLTGMEARERNKREQERERQGLRERREGKTGFKREKRGKGRREGKKGFKREKRGEKGSEEASGGEKGRV